MEYLLRSMLFVPGYQEKYIESALEKKPDAIILDFEDSVPVNLKQKARENVAEYIKKGCFKSIPTFIRLNPLEDGVLEEDLKWHLSEDINGFLLPKVTTAQDVLKYERQIAKVEVENKVSHGWFRLLPLIENAMAIENITEIATASERNMALCFGGEDYLNDIRAVHGKVVKAFDYPRLRIVVAARAAGLQPIDTPFLDFSDNREFIREQSASYEMGFSGMLIVHPNQIRMANECFMPSRSEIDKAMEIIHCIDTAQEEGAGIAIMNGKMIGPPMEKQARNILQLKQLRDKKERKEKDDK